MKIFSAIAFFLLITVLVSGQTVQVDRQVIGSTGATHSGSFFIDSSVGESVILTGGAGNIVITQGFEQPMTKNLLTAEINTTAESCRGANDGSVVISEISGCSGPYNILWSNGSAGESAQGLASGIYSVSIAIATANCQIELPFVIELEDEENCELIFYSGITPNNDGDNDYWHIENIDLPQFEDNSVSVFNRWGAEVWSGDQYDNDRVRWEGQGRSDGNLPDGTYFYVAEINGTVYKGYIELTR